MKEEKKNRHARMKDLKPAAVTGLRPGSPAYKCFLLPPAGASDQRSPLIRSLTACPDCFHGTGDVWTMVRTLISIHWANR